LVYGHSIARELVQVSVSAQSKEPKSSTKKRKRGPEIVRGKARQRQRDVDDMDVDEQGDIMEDDKDEGRVEDDAESPAWTAEAYITGTNYHAKKTNFLLFINRTRSI
jgi:DNA mismatch repair protein MLH1